MLKNLKFINHWNWIGNRAGWRQLIDTIHDIKHLKVVGMFLLAYWFYIDGVDTIVKMAVDYGPPWAFLPVSYYSILLVQFIVFPRYPGLSLVCIESWEKKSGICGHFRLCIYHNIWGIYD
ncbi:MAG: hypothetical protein Ct9H300mP29_3810 [Candidatus Neomarinimicrobiota bacterium]|nr:MAG: hypothetical protein Ct9H300mP29_3810 [Candidatus Neomarinimicrobiota bacterium]